MDLINQLEWRYATKKFDSEKKVSPADLTYLKRAIQLAPSSYGLQLYKVLVIEDPTIREKLKPVSWDQSQITDCSHLFVFCIPSVFDPKNVDEYIKLTSQVREVALDQLEGYGSFMKTKLEEQSTEELATWMGHQPYLALSNLMIAGASLGIDVCPMEGFESKAYDEILQLKEQNLTACVIGTVGYRHQEDASQNQAKVRKPLDLLFEDL